MAKQIFLTGIVSEWMAEDVRWMLSNTSEKQIDLYISSWGGSVNKGLEIANLIQGMSAGGKKDIHTYNLAHADSIATAIFLAANKENRHIVENSTMFVHEPRFIVFDEVTQNDAEKMKAELEMQTNRLADFYVKNIEGITKDEALALMNNEENLTAQQMLDYGIVSEVMPNFEIAATRKLFTNHNNTNMSLFKNKQPINTMAINDGSVIAYSGELKEGAEIQKVGEIVNLEGEHEATDGTKLTVDANNKVTAMEAPKAPETPVNTQEIVDEVVEAVAESLTELEKKIDAKIEAIKKNGSSAVIPKGDNNQQGSEVAPGTQASARKNFKDALKEVQAAKRKRQGLV